MAQESRPAATNCETARDVSAGSLKSTSIVSQPNPETAVQLSRIESLLDRIVRSLAPLVGAL